MKAMKQAKKAAAPAMKKDTPPSFYKIFGIILNSLVKDLRMILRMRPAKTEIKKWVGTALSQPVLLFLGGLGPRGPDPHCNLCVFSR